MSGWRKVALAVLAAAAPLACKETIAAPGNCPDLCPAGEVQLADTVLTGVVTSDSSFRGYVTQHESQILVFANEDSLQAYTLLRFGGRNDFWFDTNNDTLRIATIDSVVMEVRLVQRDTAVNNLRLLIYRVAPDSIDTLSTYADIAALVHDSVLIDSIPVEDTLAVASLRRRLDPARMEPLATDSGAVGVVLALRADAPTVATIASVNNTGVGARLSWFVRAADTSKTHTFTVQPFLDTFVRTPPPPAVTATEALVGDLPSARAIIRFNLPSALVDSTTVVRATLLLTPTRPITGRPDESFVLEARGIVRDFGPKSFFTPDEALIGTGLLSAGDSAEVGLDITNIVRTWRGIPADTLPRTVMLRIEAEGLSLGGLRFARATTGPTAPRLRLTYIRPFVFGVP